MSREMIKSSKRPRISVDVQPETRRRLRVAAAKNDLTVRQYLLSAIEDRLKKDLQEMEEQGWLLALTSQTDPVLAKLWGNEKDADYDKL